MMDNVETKASPLRSDVAQENQEIMNNLVRSELLGHQMTNLRSEIDGKLRIQQRPKANLFKYASSPSRTSDERMDGGLNIYLTQ